MWLGLSNDPLRGRDQGLSGRHGGGGWSGPRGPQRADHGAGRALGLRQDDVAADGQPDDRADVGPDQRSTTRTPRRWTRPSCAAASATSSSTPASSRTAPSPTTSRTVPRLLGLGQGARPATRSLELLERVGLPRGVRRPLPAPALRRPAAAGRRRPGARRRPAGDAHGRAVQRRRPDRARAAAGRVPAAAGRARQDDPLRHPRHRRGGEARRPGRGAPGGRQARPARRPRDPARRPARRLRRRLRRPRPRLPRARLPRGPVAARRDDEPSVRARRRADEARRARTRLGARRRRRRQARSAGSSRPASRAPVDRDDLHRGGTVARIEGSAAGRARRRPVVAERSRRRRRRRRPAARHRHRGRGGRRARGGRGRGAVAPAPAGTADGLDPRPPRRHLVPHAGSTPGCRRCRPLLGLLLVDPARVAAPGATAGSTPRWSSAPACSTRSRRWRCSS